MTEYEVTSRDLRVREKPSIGPTGILGALSIGDIVEVDDTPPATIAGHVWLHHERGWSAERTQNGSWVGLELVPDILPVPAPGPTPEIEPELPAAGVLFSPEQIEAIQGIVAQAVDEKLLPYWLHAATMANAWDSLSGYLTEEE